MNTARIISACGRVPLVGASLRKVARLYPEGSVTNIRSGHLAGYRWKRSHRYVSGYWLGIYELAIQECLVRELQSGDVFYDVGANAGFFSLLASKCVGPTGRVYAFEPLPENICSIRSQLELNGIENCTVVEAAVSDCQSKIEFCNGSTTSTAHILGLRNRVGEDNVFSVNATTIDGFARDAVPADFIKVDIEGAEIMALRGASSCLGGDHPPRMLIEFHGEELVREGCSVLSGYDYDLLSLTGEPFVTGPGQRHVLCVPRGTARGRGRVERDLS